MTVRHAVLEMAVHISRIPVCNRCKEIFELNISKIEKAVEVTRKDWNNLAQPTLPNAVVSYSSLGGFDVSQRLIIVLQ